MLQHTKKACLRPVLEMLSEKRVVKRRGIFRGLRSRKLEMEILQILNMLYNEIKMIIKYLCLYNI